MIRRLFKTRRKQILLDLNTQKDFFLADGKACIRNHRRILANIRRIVAWARAGNIPVISICEVVPNNNGFSQDHYCIDGTEGQKKIHYTLLSRRISFPADSRMDIPQNLLNNYRQVIFHKRTTDPFEEPRIERLLSELKPSEFIIIGDSIEGAVQASALGLLQRGKKVTVISDALGSHNKREAVLALRKIQAKGGKIIEAKHLAGISHLRFVGTCKCHRCRTVALRDSLGAVSEN